MTPSEKIDQLIAGIADWRGKTFAALRKAILDADKEIIEEWKWMGSPVWSLDFLEGDKVNARALKALVRAAAAYNQSRKKTPAAKKAKASKNTARK